MRSTLIILTVFLAIIGCSTPSDNMEVSGFVKGLKKGTLYLQKFDDSIIVTIDSMVIDGEPEFKFKYQLESPEVFSLLIKLKDGTLKDDRILFFGENGEIIIKTKLNSFGSSARITGSKNDSLLRDYNKLKQQYVSKNLDLIQERLQNKMKGKDSASREIEKREKSLLSSKYLATVNFALNHKDFEIAPYVMLTEAPHVNIKYLDTVYNSFPQKIKDSKYGTQMESFIKSRGKAKSL